MDLGKIITTGFLMVVSFRPLLRRQIVLRTESTLQPLRGFLLDFGICILAGVIINVYDGLMFAIPLSSQVALMIGCLSAGFFIGLDTALAEERRIILEAMEKNNTPVLPKRFFPITRKFTLVAITSIIMVGMVLVLVFARDVDWLTSSVHGPEAIEDARLSVTLEIIFILSVLLVLMINLITSYSRNLRLLFNNETRVLEAVRSGDLSRKVPVATGDEFGIIAQHTNHMIDGLRHRFELISALEIAEEVQQNLLPAASPLMRRYAVSGTSIYCDQTGGDYYDYLDLGDSRQGIVVADACGHGAGAAMLMTSVRAFLKAASDEYENPETLIRLVNRHISRDCMRSSRFTTMFFLELSDHTPAVRWVRAGHEPPLIYHPETDTFSRLEGPGLVLGIEPDYEFVSSSRSDLKEGDVILITTDGINETQNDRGEQYGVQRLEEILRHTHTRQPHQILERITGDVAKFRGRARQNDDITLVVIKLLVD